ncbi:extracellular solute-binding protein [Jatrophihabitans endophyticus]|uniref:extracellular solute-binding protein n=1 Tax=Jatrophihabitans endophyticus TaxID=1206085 RepID=UPI001A0F0F47|nr:extracellular solute-binding protein [Jatrophihabitans endophyticus]MBE7187511.1 extracellular solute-binding protein [Jatrophihabitans endophyticus]
MITVSTRRRGAAAALAVGAVAALTLTACSSPTSGGSSNIALVGFSTPKPAYDALSAAFEKTSAGKGVSFTPTYGPSGTESKAVLAGQQKADYVALSTGGDMTALVPSKVSSGWDSTSTKGFGADSVVVIVVRPGNPLHITGWDDLTKPGVKIVTPDPASSGSAKWNLLAAYEHVISEGGTATQAEAYVTQFFAHVVSRAESGSVAASQFEAGTGNVLISYESEAIAARQAGQKLDYIVPKQSMLIQTPVAVTKTAPKAAKSFLSYVESPAGQKIFAANGWRPALSGVNPGTVKGANDPSNPYPTVQKLTTIAQLGGWDTVNDKFFGDPNGIITKIESS